MLSETLDCEQMLRVLHLVSKVRRLVEVDPVNLELFSGDLVPDGLHDLLIRGLRVDVSVVLSHDRFTSSSFNLDQPLIHCQTSVDLLFFVAHALCVRCRLSSLEHTSVVRSEMLDDGLELINNSLNL